MAKFENQAIQREMKELGLGEPGDDSINKEGPFYPGEDYTYPNLEKFLQEQGVALTHRSKGPEKPIFILQGLGNFLSASLTTSFEVLSERTDAEINAYFLNQNVNESSRWRLAKLKNDCPLLNLDIRTIRAAPTGIILDDGIKMIDGKAEILDEDYHRLMIEVYRNVITQVKSYFTGYVKNIEEVNQGKAVERDSELAIQDELIHQINQAIRLNDRGQLERLLKEKTIQDSLVELNKIHGFTKRIISDKNAPLLKVFLNATGAKNLLTLSDAAEIIKNDSLVRVILEAKGEILYQFLLNISDYDGYQGLEFRQAEVYDEFLLGLMFREKNLSVERLKDIFDAVIKCDDWLVEKVITQGPRPRTNRQTLKEQFVKALTRPNLAGASPMVYAMRYRGQDYYYDYQKYDNVYAIDLFLNPALGLELDVVLEKATFDTRDRLVSEGIRNVFDLDVANYLPPGIITVITPFMHMRLLGYLNSLTEEQMKRAIPTIGGAQKIIEVLKKCKRELQVHGYRIEYDRLISKVQNFIDRDFNSIKTKIEDGTFTIAGLTEGERSYFELFPKKVARYAVGLDNINDNVLKELFTELSSKKHAQSNEPKYEKGLVAEILKFVNIHSQEDIEKLGRLIQYLDDETKKFFRSKFLYQVQNDVNPFDKISQLLPASLIEQSVLLEKLLVTINYHDKLKDISWPYLDHCSRLKYAVSRDNQEIINEVAKEKPDFTLEERVDLVSYIARCPKTEAISKVLNSNVLQSDQELALETLRILRSVTLGEIRSTSGAGILEEVKNSLFNKLVKNHFPNFDYQLLNPLTSFNSFIKIFEGNNRLVERLKDSFNTHEVLKQHFLPQIKKVLEEDLALINTNPSVIANVLTFLSEMGVKLNEAKLKKILRSNVLPEELLDAVRKYDPGLDWFSIAMSDQNAVICPYVIKHKLYERWHLDQKLSLAIKSDNESVLDSCDAVSIEDLTNRLYAKLSLNNPKFLIKLIGKINNITLENLNKLRTIYNAVLSDMKAFLALLDSNAISNEERCKCIAGIIARDAGRDDKTDLEIKSFVTRHDLLNNQNNQYFSTEYRVAFGEYGGANVGDLENIRQNTERYTFIALKSRNTLEKFRTFMTRNNIAMLDPTRVINLWDGSEYSTFKMDLILLATLFPAFLKNNNFVLDLASYIEKLDLSDKQIAEDVEVILSSKDLSQISITYLLKAVLASGEAGLIEKVLSKNSSYAEKCFNNRATARALFNKYIEDENYQAVSVIMKYCKNGNIRQDMLDKVCKHIIEVTQAEPVFDAFFSHDVNFSLLLSLNRQVEPLLVRYILSHKEILDQISDDSLSVWLRDVLESGVDLFKSVYSNPVIVDRLSLKDKTKVLDITQLIQHKMYDFIFEGDYLDDYLVLNGNDFSDVIDGLVESKDFNSLYSLMRNEKFIKHITKSDCDKIKQFTNTAHVSFNLQELVIRFYGASGGYDRLPEKLPKREITEEKKKHYIDVLVEELLQSLRNNNKVNDDNQADIKEKLQKAVSNFVQEKDIVTARKDVETLCGGERYSEMAAANADISMLFYGQSIKTGQAHKKVKTDDVSERDNVKAFINEIMYYVNRNYRAGNVNLVKDSLYEKIDQLLAENQSNQNVKDFCEFLEKEPCNSKQYKAMVKNVVKDLSDKKVGALREKGLFSQDSLKDFIAELFYRIKELILHWSTPKNQMQASAEKIEKLDKTFVERIAEKNQKDNAKRL